MLHDLAEDYHISPSEIAEIFQLTPWETKALSALTRHPSITYRDYIDGIVRLTGIGGECAQSIKIADLQDNLSRCRESLKRRYLDALEALG